MSPIIVGRLGRAFGTQGWVKIISYTSPKENILSYLPWQLYLNNNWCTVDVTQTKQQGNSLLVHIKGYNTPEDIKQLTNIEIAIDKEQLPFLPEGEYYWSDLIGLTVIDTQDKTLGVISRILETGANDVIVIKGEKEILVPYISQYILSIDMKQKIMRINWE